MIHEASTVDKKKKKNGEREKDSGRVDARSQLLSQVQAQVRLASITDSSGGRELAMPNRTFTHCPASIEPELQSYQAA